MLLSRTFCLRQKNKPERTRKMPTGGDATDTLETPQGRLKQLEDQLLKLYAGGHPEATGPSASSTGAQPTIRVSIPREKRFGKYGGIRDDRVLEDWIPSCFTWRVWPKKK